jgi:hypothetical protein
MKFLATLDLGGGHSGGGYAVTVRPSPGLREHFEAETLERARAEYTRQAEHERLAALSPDERRAFVQEQRARLAESERLLAMTQEQRREFVERARREYDGEVLFTEPVFTETPRVYRQPRKRRDDDGVIYKRHADQSRSRDAGTSRSDHDDDADITANDWERLLSAHLRTDDGQAVHGIGQVVSGIAQAVSDGFISRDEFVKHDRRVFEIILTLRLENRALRTELARVEAKVETLTRIYAGERA